MDDKTTRTARGSPCTSGYSEATHDPEGLQFASQRKRAQLRHQIEEAKMLIAQGAASGRGIELADAVVILRIVDGALMLSEAMHRDTVARERCVASRLSAMEERMSAMETGPRWLRRWSWPPWR